MNENDAALICRALGDAKRLRIVRMLSDGEKCACKLLEELNISQSTLSHHMKILCDSGMVTGRKQGTWMHYSISAEGAQAAKDLLTELTTVTGGEECICC